VLGSVIVPEAVMSELQFDPSRADTSIVQSAIDNKWLTVEKILSLPENEFPPSLGAGEQAAIFLASNKQYPVLLDDRLARQYAIRIGLVVIGTAGVLIRAKHLGRIPEVSSLLDTLQSNGYYFSAALVKKIKELAGEI